MSSRSSEPVIVNGRYEIAERPLGEGGSGLVYKAYDQVSKRFVALKALWPQQGADCFAGQWRVRRDLRHRNIVEILDTGVWADEGGERPYFVMPLLSGAPLTHISLPLPVERVADIVTQACRGLQAAHEQGLVDGDLHPGRLFLTDDGTIKILDLGVRPRQDRGTALYGAPELAEGKPATALSDIFSLGAICYEALTGRHPFAGEGAPASAAEINPAVNQMVSRAVRKALAKEPSERFSQAREFGETLEKAARSAPVERFERAKVQPRLERIKKAHGEGDNEFALEILSELESEGHSEPDMPALRTRIEEALREKSIRQLLESARIRMEEEEYPLALQKIAAVFAIDPENADARTMKERIESLRIAHRVEDWFQFVEEHLQANRFRQARQGLQEVLRLDSSNTQARQMLAEIDQTEHEIEKVREEKQRLYESALAAHRHGEIGNALNCLEKALALNRRATRWNTKGVDAPAEGAPDLDEQCQIFYEQVRAERDGARRAYEEGRKHLLEGNVGRALDICEEHLARHPGDPMFQALQLEAEEVRRQEQSAAIAEVSARVDAEPDLDKKYGILGEAIEKYPGESHFRSALKLIRDRRDLVNAIVSRARQHEERAQFEDARGQWDILRNIYPLFPGLDSELERLARRKEEQAKADAKTRWLEHIEAHCALGDYAQAGAVAAEALREFPEDRDLLEWQSVAAQGVERRAASDALLKEGEDLCADRRYEDGLERLRRAERLEPRNYKARAALLSALVAQARALIAHDWHAGEPLVKEALDLEPSDPIARGLLAVLDDHRRQDIIANILAAARTYQADGHLSDALQMIERGLAQYPNDHRLTQLLQSLTAQAGQPPVPPAPREPAAATVPLFAEAKQPRLFTAPATSAAAPDSDAAAGTGAAESALVPLSRHRSTARPRSAEPPLPVPTPVQSMLEEVRFKGPVWGFAGVAALALIVAAGAYSLLTKPRPAAPTGSAADARTHTAEKAPAALGSRAVVFAANVPGTAFSEGGKALGLVSELSMGEHRVEAFHDGYQPEVKSFRVAADSGALAVKFDLQPILGQLRLSSTIANGKLLLDEAEALEVRGGAAGKDALALGPHTVKIYDRGRLVFAFAFETEANQQPMLITPLLTQPVGGAVVASLRGSAKIYTTRGWRAAPLDPNSPAVPLAPVPPLGLDIPGSSAKPARFLLETGKGHPWQQSADGSDVPTLSVHLTGGAEQTSLTITANAAHCLVAVDGQPLKEPMSGTSQSIMLAPGSHPIRLTCPGYQEAEQTAAVRAGDAAPHPLNFALTPLAAQAPARRALLTIAGAPPEALVFQNQIRIGTVGPDGSFSKEIEPGSYTWEWRKPGFETRKESRSVTAGESLLLDGALAPSTGRLLLKVLPDSARISAYRSADNRTLVLPNNTPADLTGGPYRITAEAPDYTPKTETLFVTAGKPLNVTWELAKTPAAAPPVRFFSNGDSWQQASAGAGWWIRPGGGYSSLRYSTGSFSIDFLKKKAKKISMLADCADSNHCIVYSLDAHSLTSKRISAGKTVVEQKQPHGMDDKPSFHLVFEMSPDAIVVKNGEGAVLSKMERRDSLGPLMIQNDNPLNID